MWPTSQQIIVAASATLCYLLSLFGLNLYQRQHYPLSQYSRRLAHLVAGFYAIIISLQLPAWMFIPICFLYSVIMAISKQHQFFNCIHCVKRETYGEILLPWGLILARLVSGDHQLIFIVAVLILTLADPAAGLVGDLRKTEQKTWLGSIVFFTVAMIVLVLFQFSLPFALVVALVLTFVEKLSAFGLDNLLIPLIGAVMLLL